MKKLTLAFTLLIQFAVFGFFRKAAPVPPGGDGPAAPAAALAGQLLRATGDVPAQVLSVPGFGVAVVGERDHRGSFADGYRPRGSPVA